MNKLYENDGFLRELRTTVTSCTEREEGFYITLEDTIFFPEEGGQYADTGLLKTEDRVIRLLDGRIDGDTITYLVSEAIIEGTEVACELDWEKRFMRMQQHSGEHILSGCINRKYGYDNVGFHLSDDGPVTLDVNGPLTSEQVYELEREVNAVISKNLPIVPSYPSREELKEISYRSKKEIDGQLRLITVGDGETVVDVCACCAPHVAYTGEIGLVIITAVQNYKGGTRISMLAGNRAIEFIRDSINTLNSIARRFTTSASEVCRVIDNRNEEMAALKIKMSSLLQKELISAIKNTQGDNKCIFMDEDISGGALKNALEEGIKMTAGYLIILMGNEKKGYTYSLTSNSLPVVPVQRELAAKLGARGGGREPLVSGRIMATQLEIMQFFKEI